MPNNTSPESQPNTPPKVKNLDYWIRRVRSLMDDASTSLSPYNVHKLRVALRNCRAISKVLSGVGEKRAWKRFANCARTPFKALGTLRDSHVLSEASKDYLAEGTAFGDEFRKWLKSSESENVEDAHSALRSFDNEEFDQRAEDCLSLWKPMIKKRRALGKAARRYLRRTQGLHEVALETGESEAWHDVRNSWKWVRYSIENFLPELREEWIVRLKSIQDALGQHHDLCVLKSSIEAYEEQTQSLDAEFALRRIERESHRQLRNYLKLIGADLALFAELEGKLNVISKRMPKIQESSQELAS